MVAYVRTTFKAPFFGCSCNPSLVNFKTITVGTVMHMGNTINLVMPPGICESFEEGSCDAAIYLFGAPSETQTNITLDLMS